MKPSSEKAPATPRFPFASWSLLVSMWSTKLIVRGGMMA
eukprot:CAMPEP_0114118372 /NCGR_PEP_ID=MMETSP0043_2-20121206/5545_1 /TAXON_ID=464988 /ORGANISM="Hemiselmis andersenii, Strain CCMP644" /LENGTH=38 /DNA_ID= /DNA_START= /DNA_END= /DNA_ORIENTATION=